MANPTKISTHYSTGYNLYAFLGRISDGYIYDVGDSAFETVGTWNDARADECDIPLTDHGWGLYTATFPTVAANIEYVVVIYLRAGAAPDTTDAYLGSIQVNTTTDALIISSHSTTDALIKAKDAALLTIYDET